VSGGLQSAKEADKTKPMTTLTAWTLTPDGTTINLSDTVIRLGLILAVYLAFTLAQRYLVRSQLLQSVALQLNLLVLSLLVIVCLEPLLAQMRSQVGSAIMASAAFLGVAIGLKLLDVAFFELVARWRQQPPVPLVVRDIARWGLGMVALVVIMHGFFPELNLNVLTVSSLVVGYIVGNATQDTLGNLFAGLALNTERPFQIGDWVTVGGHVGMIVDTTWRATRLRTKNEDYIVIPNASIAKESVINFSRPTPKHACRLSIGVSYDTPPNRARQVILDVLRETPRVSAEPAPVVYLVNYGDFAINFTIKFFIDDYAIIDNVQSDVLDRLWYAFRREGISIPFPVHDERQHDAMAEAEAQRVAEQTAIRQLLSGVDMFQSLTPEELNLLVDQAKFKLFAAGESLCRQGESGDSFYIISRGRVAVLMSAAGGPPVVVAHTESGGFFGEMSLLTGEPRSGTVRAETDVEVLRVAKQDFAGLLQANEGLAGKIASVLEKRLAERQNLRSAFANQETNPEIRIALATRIRRFFGLGKT
jgi:small-conductance mechanosensitive channel/CRP-like cAMP-binding protein